MQRYIKKTKLFLCSRDIQVGDKLIKDGVEYEAHSRPDGVPFIGYYNKDWCYIDNDCFKVIGEISPDATWVKEGMEYDEKDFYMEKELDVSDNLYETGIVKIKGPCGHYH